MFRKAAIAALALLFFAPAAALLGVGVLMNPAAAYCATPAGTVNLGPIPDSLTVTTANGETYTLNRRQLTLAATIISVGNGITDVGRPGIKIALMAALTESTLRMLTNTGAYPESANYPNDGNGGDHDSLGLFQVRPQSGWGSVADLMDPTYQARAFFGGPTGPNYPSPRGLLDIPGWQQMDPGEAAQAVEVSAYPDRYRNYAPVADSILAALTSGGSTPVGVGGPAVSSSRVVFPLPEGTWVLTSPFGMRTHPITGERKMHTGTDFAAPDGTPILAAADGTVTVAEFSGGYGGLIVIEHTIDGKTVATAYALRAHVAKRHPRPRRRPRERRAAHRRCRLLGHEHRRTSALRGPARRHQLRGHRRCRLAQRARCREPADGDQWITRRPQQRHCGHADRVDGDPDRLVDDPTSSGKITARMLHLYQQTIAAFPTPAGAATHPVAAPSPSTHSAEHATSPSATAPASDPPRHSWTPAGRSPTG